MGYVISPETRARLFVFLLSKRLNPMAKDVQHRTGLDVAAAFRVKGVLEMFDQVVEQIDYTVVYFRCGSRGLFSSPSYPVQDHADMDGTEWTTALIDISTNEQKKAWFL